MNSRFDQLEAGLLSLASGLNKLENGFTGFTGRFEALERTMQQGFADVKKEFKIEIRREIDRSIDEMGRIVKQGFDHVDERFNQMDQRFEQVDGRFAHLEQRTERIEIRLDQAAYRFELVELETRVSILEQRK